LHSGTTTPSRVVVFGDEGLAEATPNYLAEISAFFAANNQHITLVGTPHLLPGGETAKRDRKTLDRALEIISETHICRHSYVLVAGGGALLDCVGLAASLAHRGVRLIRVATTTLSQSDSALGVKNGINAFGQKNYLGVYDVPWAVIHDEATLATLCDEDWCSGFSEAVKVALLKDTALFEAIEHNAEAIRQRDEDAGIPVIRASAKHHFDHITRNGDPFERGDARPLDFGHWAAHKLEQMSGYTIRHGAAVAIGLALDVTYARLQGWLDESVHERILQTLDALGFTLQHPLLKQRDTLMGGLSDFQEHLGGVRSIPMIRDVGDAFEVHEIDEAVMAQALAWLRAWHPATVASGRSIA
ncbi:MAG: 3-dehydroquinate synthase, partial [Candidatus Hydrogenedentes bacterium]|nr:3-dehydroquinate synthase [Candidatus Hydrogenedentota bacterium]